MNQHRLVGSHGLCRFSSSQVCDQGFKFQGCLPKKKADARRFPPEHITFMITPVAARNNEYLKLKCSTHACPKSNARTPTVKFPQIFRQIDAPTQHHVGKQIALCIVCFMQSTRPLKRIIIRTRTFFLPNFKRSRLVFRPRARRTVFTIKRPSESY